MSKVEWHWKDSLQAHCSWLEDRVELLDGQIIIGITIKYLEEHKFWSWHTLMDISFLGKKGRQVIDRESEYLLGTMATKVKANDDIRVSKAEVEHMLNELGVKPSVKKGRCDGSNDGG